MDNNTATTSATVAATAHFDAYSRVIADLPGYKPRGDDTGYFWCTEEHSKRRPSAWVAILGDKLRIGCYDDPGHNDALWHNHVQPNLRRPTPGTAEYDADKLRRDSLAADRAEAQNSWDTLTAAFAASMGQEHVRTVAPDPRRSIAAGPPDFVPLAHNSAKTTDLSLCNTRTQVGNFDLLGVDWQPCSQYAVYLLADFRGDEAKRGWGCGLCSTCKSNDARRKHGKPYAAGASHEVTDIVITGDPDMQFGAQSPVSRLLNAKRQLRDGGAQFLLGPGFDMRIIFNRVVEDVEGIRGYLEKQAGVLDVDVRVGEPPTYADLRHWQGDRPEVQHGRQRWRRYRWPTEPPPDIRGAYDTDERELLEGEGPEDTADTENVLMLKAYVSESAPGEGRKAAHRWAEKVVVTGYVDRGAELPRVWRRLVSDAVDKLSCLTGDCGCKASGHPRHVEAAQRRWTPATMLAAGYLGSARPCASCWTPYATAEGTAQRCPACEGGE